MNPYEQIALEHLSIKQLEGCIAKLKTKGSPQELTDLDKMKNRFRKNWGMI